MKYSRFSNYWFLLKYKIEYTLYRIIGLKIYCDGEREWFGFHWFPKNTTSYQMYIIREFRKNNVYWANIIDKMK